jgi:hypothetical protein
LDDGNRKQLKQLELHQLTDLACRHRQPLTATSAVASANCWSSHVLNDGAANRDVGFHSLIIRLLVCLGQWDLPTIFSKTMDQFPSA